MLDNLNNNVENSRAQGLDVNDDEVEIDLLEIFYALKKKILLVPGKGFNWQQPDHFRVVYLPRIEVLSECMTNLDDFLHHYRQA